jgi:hypothetical protein
MPALCLDSIAVFGEYRCINTDNSTHEVHTKQKKTTQSKLISIRTDVSHACALVESSTSLQQHTLHRWSTKT